MKNDSTFNPTFPCPNEDRCAAIARLEEKQRMLLSSLSHELRNPLTLVSSTLQLMEREHPEVTEYRHWSQIRADIAGAIALLRELSDYNSRSAIVRQKISPPAFFAEIAQQIEPSALLQQKQLTWSVPSALPDFYGDPLKLKCVFVNLLKNSLEATDEGDAITMDAQADNGLLTVRVANNGRPIPQDHLATLFEPFVTYKRGGTGLGLAIAKGIIQAHGGTISAESAAWTTFTVQLPLGHA